MIAVNNPMEEDAILKNRRSITKTLFPSTNLATQSLIFVYLHVLILSEQHQISMVQGQKLHWNALITQTGSNSIQSHFWLFLQQSYQSHSWNALVTLVLDCKLLT